MRIKLSPFNYFLLLILFLNKASASQETSKPDNFTTFYDNNSLIEEHNSTTFKKYVVNSNRITIMEYYAKWCVISQWFQVVWNDFANQTQHWKSVLRIAGMDCDNTYNELEVCKKNGVAEYPNFKLYHARQHNFVGATIVDGVELRSEQFMKTVIDFIEKQRHPPREWPTLYPYVSSLESIFDSDKDQKYLILIFESTNSYLGRKLILDFSPYLDEIIIRRVTNTTNPKLFEKLGVKKNIEEPEFFLITNTHDSNKKFESFNDFVKTMKRNQIHNTVDNSILKFKYGVEQRVRFSYMAKIFDFIKYNDLEFDLNAADL